MGDGTPAPRNFAERYETTLVPVIFVPWARELIRRAAPMDGERILDLACGTGVVTREIAATGIRPGSLTGADHSAEMLAVARTRAAEARVAADWVEADAGALPFPDASFDLALCQQALQFFPDRTAALSELRRVLVPGGRAVFCVQCALEVNPMLRAQAETLEKHVGEAAGNAVRAICGLPDADEIRALFEAAGFREVEIETVALTLRHPDARAFAEGAMGGMHTGDKLSALDADRRTRSVEDFLTALGPLVTGRALTFPHVSNVIAARV